MQQEYAETLSKPATLYVELDGEGAVAAVADQRNTARKSMSRAALHRTCVKSDAAVMAPETEFVRQTVWSRVLNFILEGFSIGGVSLNPTNDFLNDNRWSDAQHQPQEMMSLNGQRVVGILPVSSPVVVSHWNWGASSREVGPAISEHLRKEREIRRAVDALSELDDKTLRDIGIPHRSRIEYVVRFCHDC